MNVNEIFVVVDGGGYDPPSYAAFYNEPAAWTLADDWEQTIDGTQGDWVDVIRVAEVGGVLVCERLERPTPTDIEITGTVLDGARLEATLNDGRIVRLDLTDPAEPTVLSVSYPEADDDR